MATQHAFENIFRSPFELVVGSVALGFGSLCLLDYPILALDMQLRPVVAVPFFLFGIWRSYQGIKLLRFRRNLLTLTPFSMGTNDVPLSTQHLYIGRGFTWLPIHRQRLHLLSLVENQGYLQKSVVYRAIQSRAKSAPNGMCAKLTQQSWLPFAPTPAIGGKPWLHGVGSDMEKSIYLNQANRNSHECIFGMTRVGKTRYLSIKVNQDIRNGEAVLVIDPKGDLEVMQDMYCAAKAVGRLDDLRLVHLGFPDVSAKYNPLSAFSNVGEVASRVTDAMSSDGGGQAFKDFAWQYVNIVARCLHILGQPINYKTIAFYIKRPELLLATYVDKIFPEIEPDYLQAIRDIESQHEARVDKEGNPLPPLKKSVIIKKYLTDYIENSVKNTANAKQLMDSIVVPLYNAAMLDKTYYDKITASVGPVLDKINQTQAESIFSWDDAVGLPIINLEDMIKRQQIVYIGLDSLTNPAMAEAVGQAAIADLVSLCGRLYTEGCAKTPLCVHVDELSNVVRDVFVNLLNKAGGAGIKVCAYTQTVNDLGAAFGGNADKAKMLIGNFGTISMLRVSNEDTAAILTQCLEQVRTRSSIPSTMSNDKADGNNGELFTTYNTDSITEEKGAIVTINDLFSLPKGQAFVMTNGGELYKIRIPLPKNDGTAPASFDALLGEVNLCFS